MSTAVPTNHSPRMNCLADFPAVTSIRNRPAVGPITPMAIAAISGSPACQRRLHADGRVPGQREGGHELVERLAELLAAFVRDENPDAAGQHAKNQIPGIRQRPRHLVQQHVARTPPPMPPKIARSRMPTIDHCLPL